MKNKRKKQRRMEFGRRSTDIFVPKEEHQKVVEDIAYMLRHMDGAYEYLQEVLSQAQASGFSFDKDAKVG